MSNGIYFLIYLIFINFLGHSGETSQWRICYQRARPCLVYITFRRVKLKQVIPILKEEQDGTKRMAAGGDDTHTQSDRQYSIYG